MLCADVLRHAGTVHVTHCIYILWHTYWYGAAFACGHIIWCSLVNSIVKTPLEKLAPNMNIIPPIYLPSFTGSIENNHYDREL